ncbi:MAG: hypothetical protein IPM17_01380 [Verrucomicrobia bacterium]|jgi:hypothetical protein|nr:hypothetical protein [Verrucomicrobiota bacterium]
MSSAHWHLITSHAPLFGIGFSLVLLAWGLLRRSADVQRAALGLYVASALLVLPAYFTGQPALGAVKGVPGYAPEVADRHADVAALSLAATLVAGGAAAAAMVVSRRGQGLSPLWVGAIALTGLLAVASLAWASNLGGQIRHVEIRYTPQ